MFSQRLLTLFYRNNYSYFPQQNLSEAISKLISSHVIQYVLPRHISKSVRYLSAHTLSLTSTTTSDFLNVPAVSHIRLRLLLSKLQTNNIFSLDAAHLGYYKILLLLLFRP